MVFNLDASRTTQTKSLGRADERCRHYYTSFGCLLVPKYIVVFCRGINKVPFYTTTTTHSSQNIVTMIADDRPELFVYSVVRVHINRCVCSAAAVHVSVSETAYTKLNGFPYT